MPAGRKGRGRIGSLLRGAAAAATASALAGCALATGLPAPTGLPERLAAFPTRGLPLEGPVTVYWNEHQVPFIQAGSDADLAFTLGLVHAHLRLGQMELLRRIARGRLAEMAGPLAVDIDRSLRILDLGRAAPAIVAAMPEATRRWTAAFVAGVNHAIAVMAPLPHEHAVLGMGREPWTLEDVVTVGRLASADVTWIVWAGLLPLRDRPDWPELWRSVIGEGAEPPGAGDAWGIAAAIAGSVRSGSNAFAVAGRRSASGGALIATDPHLGIQLPNLWLLAGYHSPSFNAVGLMIPGLPFIAVGRNADIAWGGTNLRSANSDLFDVSGLPPEAFTSREVPIAVRWWPDATLRVRESAFGPVITDAPVLRSGGAEAALRWIGHRPSDELSAMLAINRATGWEEFRAALDGYAISPQNFIYADRQGHVGRVTATQLPARPPGPPPDIVLKPQAASAWDRIVTSRDLPFVFDPPEGFVASANNRPPGEAPVPIGWFFSAEDRIDRLGQLLAGDRLLSVEDVMGAQLDVHMASAVRLRDALLARLDAADLQPAMSDAERGVVLLLRGWDGGYEASSRGALAFEQVLARFVEGFADPGRLAAYDAAGRPLALLAADVAAAPSGQVIVPLRRAIAAAAEPIERFGDWGGMHRLELSHPLALIPLIGGRYRFGNEPVAGSRSTLMKTSHGFTTERHVTRYGSQARAICDLADPDANWFALLGGQDGWLGSSTFLDQAALWREGRYVRIPLRVETVREEFRHAMRLGPG